MIKQTWVQMSTPLLTTCVTSCKLPNLSEPQSLLISNMELIGIIDTWQLYVFLTHSASTHGTFIICQALGMYLQTKQKK